MTWLAARIFLKKVWHFFKTYWYIPLSLSWAAVAWLVFRGSGVNMADILHKAEQSYRDQINILNKGIRR